MEDGIAFTKADTGIREVAFVHVVLLDEGKVGFENV